MIDKEILDKVRRIEIASNRLVTDVFAGQYHSVFKGRGMEFDEVREYQFGDDIRSIDWNVTARTGVAHIKKYVEERELTVMILVDCSRSCHFATVNQLKSRLAAEIAAVLAFSAIRNNDKIGLMMFTDQVEKFIPPRKGKSHVLRIIREVLCFKPQRHSTDLSNALEYFNRVTTRKAVSFVISDFFDDSLEHSGAGAVPAFKKVMTIINRRHDLIAVTLNDPREFRLPRVGLLDLQDAETGRIVTVDTNADHIRRAYEEKAEARQVARDRMFRSMGVDHIDISTDQPYADALVEFFRTRQRRLRV